MEVKRLLVNNCLEEEDMYKPEEEKEEREEKEEEEEESIRLHIFILMLLLSLWYAACTNQFAILMENAGKNMYGNKFILIILNTYWKFQIYSIFF